jgi:hypothetical protein
LVVIIFLFLCRACRGVLLAPSFQGFELSRIFAAPAQRLGRAFLVRGD